jgi:hypothetical protein
MILEVISTNWSILGDCIDFMHFLIKSKRAFDNVVVKALGYKPEGRGFETR